MRLWFLNFILCLHTQTMTKQNISQVVYLSLPRQVVFPFQEIRNLTLNQHCCDIVLSPAWTETNLSATDVCIITSEMEMNESVLAVVRSLAPSCPLMNRVQTTCAHGLCGQTTERDCGLGQAAKWHFNRSSVCSGFPLRPATQARQQRLGCWRTKKGAGENKANAVNIKEIKAPLPPFVLRQLSSDFQPRRCRNSVSMGLCCDGCSVGVVGDKVRLSPPMTVLAGGAAGASSRSFPA